MKQKKIYTVATAHLDTIWNWSLETTIGAYLPKTLRRNFALFEQYPDYRFSFEGSYRYALTEEYYPQEFERLKAYVAAGRWNVAGSAYENGDVNIPSPEALFRNFLYGNRYFEKTFGVRSRDVFLPDCFGFGRALPSIAAHCDLLGFSTQKLAWGSAFGVPFDIGRWIGVDGKSIFAALNMHNYFYSFSRIRSMPFVRDKLRKNEAYGLDVTAIYHGVGDRGGAPLEPSVKTLEREMADNRVYDEQVLSAASDELFKDLAKPENEALVRQLPTFSDELLLTNHGAGCYTARTGSKRWNAQGESMAVRAEKAAVTAHLLGESPYDRAANETAWKRLIAHQFHDDLTGTAIQKEYLRSWNDYAASLLQFHDLYTTAAAAVTARLDTSFCKGTPLCLHNACSAAYTGAVTCRLPAEYETVRVFDDAGRETPAQVYVDETGVRTLAVFAVLPANAYRVYDLRKSAAPFADDGVLRADKHLLENETLRVTLNENGDVCSLIDKTASRELLRQPLAAELLSCKGSMEYPAWELRYGEVMAQPVGVPETVRVQVLCSGPVYAALRVEKQWGASRFSTVISLTRGAKQVAFANEIDWHETAMLLKHCFSFTADNDLARYDLGLGSITRGTNTPQRYEVPAQKWAMLPDKSGAFAVGIISDARRGWDKPDAHTLRLTGVFTPRMNFRPDSMQSMLDFGLNRYAFAVCALSGEDVPALEAQAAAFCCPPAAFLCKKHKGDLVSPFVPFSLSGDTAALRAVKLAEDEDAVVVRVNEIAGKPLEDLRVSFAFPLEEATEIFATETPIAPAATADGALTLSLSPYAVRSFKLRFAAPEKKRAKQANAPLPFNTRVFAAPGEEKGGFWPGKSYALPSSQMCAAVQSGGLHFSLVADPHKNNALLCQGQTLNVPRGAKAFVFLGAAPDTAATYRFFADDSPVDVTVQGAAARLGGWDLPDLNAAAFLRREKVALEFTHTNSSSGANIADRRYFYRYTVPVQGCATLRLPENSDLLLLSAVFTTALPPAECLTELLDTLPARTVQRADYVPSRVSYLGGKALTLWRQFF